MFNFIKNVDGLVKLSNRIFETRIYNLFVSEAQTSQAENEIINEGSMDKPLFIINGKLNMKKVLERFCVHFNEIYDKKDEKFLEKQGRAYRVQKRTLER